MKSDEMDKIGTMLYGATVALCTKGHWGEAAVTAVVMLLAIFATVVLRRQEPGE